MTQLKHGQTILLLAACSIQLMASSSPKQATTQAKSVLTEIEEAIDTLFGDSSQGHSQPTRMGTDRRAPIGAPLCLGAGPRLGGSARTIIDEGEAPIGVSPGSVTGAELVSYCTMETTADR